mgnify:CR=1 FL=1|jgi:hypothetical protein|tara:strand:- start:366 stop:617 length:252 start_codon:yes stop_codon:yes gene_type:complete
MSRKKISWGDWAKEKTKEMESDPMFASSKDVKKKGLKRYSGTWYEQLQGASKTVKKTDRKNSERDNPKRTVVKKKTRQEGTWK